MSEELTKEGLDELEKLLRGACGGPLKPFVPELRHLLSMARRTLEAEERLEKAQRTICFFASIIKSGESWSSTCQKEMDEVLGRPKAIHPPQECAPPEVTDVLP